MLFISVVTVFLASAIGQVSAWDDRWGNGGNRWGNDDNGWGNGGDGYNTFCPDRDAIPMTFKAGTFSTVSSTCGYDLSDDHQDGRMPWIATPDGAGHAQW